MFSRRKKPPKLTWDEMQKASSRADSKATGKLFILLVDVQAALTVCA